MDRASPLNLYRQMLLIRRFEERSAEMYALGKIGGFCHLYIGEEAVAVGALDVLRPDDYVFSSYRDHGHCLARGCDPKAVMAELFGRSTGLCKGKGGSMHLIDVERRFMGGYAIVGGHLPLATGAAFAINYRNGDQIVLCFFGEGAVPTGACHETLNLAAMWGLPVLFLCENNRYCMGTPVERAVALYADVVKNAAAYGIEAGCVDGMDVLAVRDAVGKAVDQIRTSKRPYFLEAATYRFLGHSMADPSHGHYRTKSEVDKAKKRDPLLLLKTKLLDERGAAEADFKTLEQEVKKIVDEAVDFAETSPVPAVETLAEDVYTGEQGGRV
ncbi:MAG: pyruvate dehydrogenase (acetyl-transferring) E1 component subunit alpha [Nitrospirota bacterium]